jgi:hypothetical protein
MCLVLTCKKMFHAEFAKNLLAFQDRPLSAFAHALCSDASLFARNYFTQRSQRFRRVREEFR